MAASDPAKHMLFRAPLQCSQESGTYSIGGKWPLRFARSLGSNAVRKLLRFGLYQSEELLTDLDPVSNPFFVSND